MFSRPATRVEDHTSEAVNERILEETRQRVACYAASPEEDLRRRLVELDYEWDIERTLEATASISALSTLLLGKLVNRRFYALTGLVAGFLMNQAVKGWSPPVPVLRRMGCRTAREIDHERQMLETALRTRVQAEKDAHKAAGRTRGEDIAERKYVPYTD